MLAGPEEPDTTWSVKRPRGYNPAIARGDLESMAVAAAAIASAGPLEPGATKGPRTSCYRSGHLLLFLYSLLLSLLFWRLFCHPWTPNRILIFGYRWLILC